MESELVSFVLGAVSDALLTIEQDRLTRDIGNKRYVPETTHILKEVGMSPVELRDSTVMHCTVSHMRVSWYRTATTHSCAVRMIPASSSHGHDASRWNTDAAL